MLAISSVFLPPLEPLTTTDFSTISVVSSFAECSIIGIVQYVAFTDWLLLLSNRRLRVGISSYDLIALAFMFFLFFFFFN